LSELRTASRDWLGPRASRPQTRCRRAVFAAFRNPVRALRSFAGGTPAVPANHLSGTDSLSNNPLQKILRNKIATYLLNRLFSE